MNIYQRRKSTETKQTLKKLLERTNLHWSELGEILSDIEINFNNRLSICPKEVKQCTAFDSK